MSLMNFLKKSTVEEVTPATRAGGAGVPRKQWTPNPATIALRVWKDGAVYPSQAARDKFDLEYRAAKVERIALPLKDGETVAEQKFRNEYEFPNGTGNGLDVVDSRVWGQFKGEGQMIFVAVTPKDKGKVDLFSTVAYEDPGPDGTAIPKVSVMDQGANTFGKDVLVPALEQVYSVKFQQTEGDGGVEFVDLLILETVGEGSDQVNITEQFSKPILLLPKRITRGKDKGKEDYSRREGVKMYLLAPASALEEGDAPITAQGEAAAEASVPAVDMTNATPSQRKAFLSEVVS